VSSESVPGSDVVRARRLSRRTFCAISASAAIAAGGIFAAAVPAHAAATATVSRSIFLAARSTGTASVSRSIFLATGTYTWEYTISGAGTTAVDQRTIFLDAGTYAWECDITGTGGTAPGADDYVTGCQLDPPANSGHVNALLPQNITSTGFWPGDSVDLPAGTYTWTGTLIPHF
jgi:hypothetical protein